MTRKTIIIIILAAVYAACVLLDAWDVAPNFKKLLEWISLPCFIFLLYSWLRWLRYRKKSSGDARPVSSLRKIHAAALNGLARVFGVMAIIVGVVFTFWGLSLVLDSKATIGVNGVPTSDPWIKASVLVVGVVVAALGVLMLMARPYEPRK